MISPIRYSCKYSTGQNFCLDGTSEHPEVVAGSRAPLGLVPLPDFILCRFLRPFGHPDIYDDRICPCQFAEFRCEVKLAILSDTHDQVERVSRALEMARDRDAEAVIHCGDITCPDVVEQFGGWNAHFVFGNCDHDRIRLARSMALIDATLHENFGQLTLGEVEIAFLHGHELSLLEDLQASGTFHYLFHGHTHVAANNLVGKTRIINPGALHRAAIKTFVVLDTETGALESVTVEAPDR